jgi:hypothetical protein
MATVTASGFFTLVVLIAALGTTVQTPMPTEEIPQAAILPASIEEVSQPISRLQADPSSDLSAEALIQAEAQRALAEKAEPSGIALSSDAPAPQEESGQETPAISVTNLSLQQKALPPVLEVTVREVKSKTSQAKTEAAVAQNFMRKGDITKAMRFQRRAVELDPSNMLYRLGLAVMFDRVSDGKDASALYRQVVEAYDTRDETLPSKLDIDGIRDRLDYLSSMAQK